MRETPGDNRKTNRLLETRKYLTNDWLSHLYIKYYYEREPRQQEREQERYQKGK